jgi:hypothetical protein
MMPLGARLTAGWFSGDLIGGERAGHCAIAGRRNDAARIIKDVFRPAAPNQEGLEQD